MTTTSPIHPIHNAWRGELPKRRAFGRDHGMTVLPWPSGLPVGGPLCSVVGAWPHFSPVSLSEPYAPFFWTAWLGIRQATHTKGWRAPSPRDRAHASLRNPVYARNAYSSLSFACRTKLRMRRASSSSPNINLCCAAAPSPAAAWPCRLRPCRHPRQCCRCRRSSPDRLSRGFGRILDMQRTGPRGCCKTGIGAIETAIHLPRARQHLALEAHNALAALCLACRQCTDLDRIFFLVGRARSAMLCATRRLHRRRAPRGLRACPHRGYGRCVPAPRPCRRDRAPAQIRSADGRRHPASLRIPALRSPAASNTSTMAGWMPNAASCLALSGERVAASDQPSDSSGIRCR